MKHAFTILALIFLCLSDSQTAALTFQSVEFRPDRLLASEPKIAGFDGASAIVVFETLAPTPGARVSFGIPLREGNLSVQRYRRSAKELLPSGKTRTKMHRIKMDISKLESVHYDTGLIRNGGGVIVYRIELFDPRINAARFYDRRFRYKRDGKPKIGTYTTGVTLTDGPFVDVVTDGSVVISWETDGASNGSVFINDTEFASTEIARHHEVRVTGLRSDTQYAYLVRYSADGGVTQAYSLRTAPAPGSQRPFKFGFMSDSRGGVGGGERSQNGVNARDLAQFAVALYNKGADLICFGGDLINGYTSDIRDFESQLETWKKFVQPVAARIPIYEAMGNHEQVGNYYKVRDPVKKNAYFLVFSDREGEESAEACFAREFVNPEGSVYGFGAPELEVLPFGSGETRTGPNYIENLYAFNYGNCHFVSLNSNYWGTGQRSVAGSSRKYADKEANNIALKHLGGNREGYMLSNQLEWLNRDLQAAQDDTNVDWVFIYLHEPAFPNGGHVRDAMYWGTPGKGEHGGYNEPGGLLGDVIDMRNRFWTIVSRYDKVLVVLCGDEHNYSRTYIDSTIYPDYRFPVWQIISGGYGAPYYVQDKSVPWVEKVESFAISKHYCLFTVDGNQVSLTVYSDTGQILDHVENLASIR